MSMSTRHKHPEGALCAAGGFYPPLQSVRKAAPIQPAAQSRQLSGGCWLPLQFPAYKKETTTIAQGKFSSPRRRNDAPENPRANDPADLDQFIDSINHLCADDRLKESAAPAKKAPLKRKSPLLPLLLFLALLLAAGGFLLLSPGKKIPQGVSVSGLSLDGLGKKRPPRRWKLPSPPEDTTLCSPAVRTFP